MVVDDFDIEGFCSPVGPFETDAPFLIDADAVLPFAVATQSLETIAGQQHQVGVRFCAFENRKALFCLLFERLKRLDAVAGRKTGRSFVAKVRRSWRLVRHHRARLPATTYDVKRL